jgi:hypothetical protein
MAPGARPGKSIALLAGAVALACIALLVLFGRPPAPELSPPERRAPAAVVEEEREPAAPAPETPAAPPPNESAPARSAPRAEADDRAPAPEAEAAPEAESAPTVPSGIGLFPPPGTDPIKIGIVVPDDFELPEGYLRHHQVTDDGQELPPILLFHPDYELLDSAGNPIPLPENRVVPPELAPPGLPHTFLEVPAPLEETGR